MNVYIIFLLFSFSQTHSISYKTRKPGNIEVSEIGMHGFLSGKIIKDTVFEKDDDVIVFVPQFKKENIEANQPVIDLLSQYAASKNATNAQISMA